MPSHEENAIELSLRRIERRVESIRDKINRELVNKELDSLIRSFINDDLNLIKKDVDKLREQVKLI